MLAEVLFLAGHNWATGATARDQFALEGGERGLGSNVERVARVLFTDFLWPFEITAGAARDRGRRRVVLARRSGQPAELVPEEVDEPSTTSTRSRADAGWRSAP